MTVSIKAHSRPLSTQVAAAGLLEHLNVTVSDADRTARMLSHVFGWRIRWDGPALNGGRSIHIGTEERYLALYAPAHSLGEAPVPYRQRGLLNHIGVLVDDLDATEARVWAAGYTTHSHQTYEPGSRFYFNDHDGIEYEVVSYA